MGPCCYCKQIIYDERIAERGWHRECHEDALADLFYRQAAQDAYAKSAAKRRLRRAEIRREKKIGVRR